MLPQTLTIQNTSANPIPSKTYKIDWDSKRISGYVDNVDAIKQAVDLHLSTERYHWIVYSWQYGSELYKLIGKPHDYAEAEAKRMIEDALSIDSRILDVTDFTFDFSKGDMICKFKIRTNDGDINSEVVVNA